MAKDPYKLKVKDVMSSDVVSVHVADTVHDALVLMGENRVSALPVVDKEAHCVGILSTSDLVDLTRELDEDINELENLGDVSQQWLIDKLAEDAGGKRVDELMTESVASVKRDMPLAEAARLMLKGGIHRLPVVDEEERLKGIVSTMDVLKAFVEGAPE